MCHPWEWWLLAVPGGYRVTASPAGHTRPLVLNPDAQGAEPPAQHGELPPLLPGSNTHVLRTIFLELSHHFLLAVF